MREIKVFVPGKIIIAGEHAVVYQKLALATSIGLGVKVRVTSSSKTEEIKNDEKGLIKAAVEIAGGIDKVSVFVESQLPIGSGLGSSAALAAAVIKGVKEFLGSTITDDELFQMTFEVEKIAHGNASGIDPATVIYRGLIAYRKGEPFERLKIKTPIKLLLINSGKPQESTKEMVELVGANPNKISIIDKVEKVVLLIKERLVAGESIQDQLDENGLLLEELGVVGEKAKQISSLLRAIGCGVKITGAGGVKSGSGMMIVVCPDYSKAKKLLDNRGIKYFETEIGEV